MWSYAYSYWLKKKEWEGRRNTGVRGRTHQKCMQLFQGPADTNATAVFCAVDLHTDVIQKHKKKKIDLETMRIVASLDVFVRGCVVTSGKRALLLSGTSGGFFWGVGWGGGRVNDKYLRSQPCGAVMSFSLRLRFCMSSWTCGATHAWEHVFDQIHSTAVVRSFRVY